MTNEFAARPIHLCRKHNSSFVIRKFVIHPSGEYRIRTCEGISHQIYSLTRLTASVTPRVGDTLRRNASLRNTPLRNTPLQNTVRRRLFCGRTVALNASLHSRSSESCAGSRSANLSMADPHFRPPPRFTTSFAYQSAAHTTRCQRAPPFVVSSNGSRGLSLSRFQNGRASGGT